MNIARSVHYLIQIYIIIRMLYHYSDKKYQNSIKKIQCMEYEADVRLILNRIKEAYKLKNDAELAKYLDVLATRISNWVSRNTVDYDLIFTKCKDLNFDWLITGLGEKYRTNIIQGDRNSVGNNQGTILGNNVGDNSINISAPTKGEQKIIYPDRTIEVTQSTQGYSYVAEPQSPYGDIETIIAEKNKEIDSLRAKVIRLQEELIERLKSDK